MRFYCMPVSLLVLLLLLFIHMENNFKILLTPLNCIHSCYYDGLGADYSAERTHTNFKLGFALDAEVNVDLLVLIQKRHGARGIRTVVLQTLQLNPFNFGANFM